MKLSCFILLCVIAVAQTTEPLPMQGQSPKYVSVGDRREQAERIRQLQNQNRLAEQALEANELKLKQTREALKKGGIDAARVANLEERLGKLEVVLAKFIDEEAKRWKATNEALDLLAKAELRRIEAAKAVDK